MGWSGEWDSLAKGLAPEQQHEWISDFKVGQTLQHLATQGQSVTGRVPGDMVVSDQGQ